MFALQYSLDCMQYGIHLCTHIYFISHLIVKTNYLIWYFICIGHKDLKDKCPEDVRAMLEEKGLFDVYEKFVQTIVQHNRQSHQRPDQPADRGALLGIVDAIRQEALLPGVLEHVAQAILTQPESIVFNAYKNMP